MNTSRFSTWLGLWALGCAGGESTPEPDSAPPEPSTAELLEGFYADHGGRDAFPSNQVMALEALLYAQDAIEAGEPDAARARIDEVFAAMPLSTPVWRDQVGYQGLNIGDPVAYYGLRMLDQVLTLGDPDRPETLTMTAVVAPCAEVRRPTLPDLEPETVSLTIAPEILADEARRLHVSRDCSGAGCRRLPAGCRWSWWCTPSSSAPRWTTPTMAR